MVFSSFVFLLAFLLLVLLIYYVCPGKVRNLVLLIASLLFYAWGEPVYVLIMLFSTVFDYTNGRLIEYFQNKNRPGKAKVVLVIDLVGNLGILGFFKYADFVIGNINSITGAGLTLLHIALPIGISFYTFQTMSYTIDVYRKVVPAQHNIVAFATYVTLFPQLIAGPIVQYKTVASELSDRKVTLTDFSEGAFRFTIGLAKKVLLANQIGSLWDTISQLHQMSAATAWLGATRWWPWPFCAAPRRLFCAASGCSISGKIYTPLRTEEGAQNERDHRPSRNPAGGAGRSAPSGPGVPGKRSALLPLQRHPSGRREIRRVHSLGRRHRRVHAPLRL